MRKYAIIAGGLCVCGAILMGRVSLADPGGEGSSDKKKCDRPECAERGPHHHGRRASDRHDHGRHHHGRRDFDRHGSGRMGSGRMGSGRMGPGRMGPHGRSMKMMGVGPLLRLEAVRDEINIDDGQLEELEALKEEIGGQMRDLFGSVRDLPREERREKMKEMHQQGKVIRDKAEGQLQEILKPEQFQRLKQIGLQMQLHHGGVRALTSGKIGEALELTDEQKKDLRDRAKQARKEVKSQIKEQVQKGKEEAWGKVKEGLSTEQRQKLETLTGPKFDMPHEFLDRDHRGPRGKGKRGPWGKKPRPE